MASLCSVNLPLDCAFAAPFDEGGRQPRSGWQGGFSPSDTLVQGFSDSHLYLLHGTHDKRVHLPRPIQPWLALMPHAMQADAIGEV